MCMREEFHQTKNGLLSFARLVHEGDARRR